MLLRAEALDLMGSRADARAVRLDSLGWARYGFGTDWAARAKLRELSVVGARKADLRARVEARVRTRANQLDEGAKNRVNTHKSTTMAALFGADSDDEDDSDGPPMRHP